MNHIYEKAELSGSGFSGFQKVFSETHLQAFCFFTFSSTQLPFKNVYTLKTGAIVDP